MLPENQPHPIDSLEITSALKQRLKAAGIHSVEQLEVELQDEKALKGKVAHFGEKSVVEIRNALRLFRSEGQHASTPPTANPPEGIPAGIPRTEGKPGGGNPKRTLAWIAVGLAAVTGGIFLVALVTLLFFGSHLTETQLYGFNIAAAIMLLVICYGALGYTKAIFRAGFWGMTLSLGGPLAGALGVLFVLTKLTPVVAPRTIWVYVTGREEDGKGAVLKTDRFTIKYRGQQGPQTIGGQDGYALAGNVPWSSNSLEVNAVECVGFITVNELRGESPPFKYPIVNGAVTIELVKKPPEKDPLPKSASVRKTLQKNGITERTVREPGKFKKTEVWLTVENRSDRQIDFALFDCVAVFDEIPPLLPNPPQDCRDVRDILPEGKAFVGDFSAFGNPSGWFCLYVRFEDQEKNRIRQQFLGAFNLFNTQEPRVVIRRADEVGIVFEVDRDRSKL